MPVPLLLDCDPGHDDVMAILLGGRTLDLRGITTVHGNASQVQTTRNARHRGVSPSFPFSSNEPASS